MPTKEEINAAVVNYDIGRKDLTAEQLEDSEELNDLWDKLERTCGVDIDLRSWQHDTGENIEDWELNVEAGVTHILGILSGRIVDGEDVDERVERERAEDNPAFLEPPEPDGPNMPDLDTAAREPGVIATFPAGTPVKEIDAMLDNILKNRTPLSLAQYISKRLHEAGKVPAGWRTTIGSDGDNAILVMSKGNDIVTLGHYTPTDTANAINSIS